MSTATRDIIFKIEHTDITRCAADAIVLKFAQGLHGADRVVASALNKGVEDMDELLPRVGDHAILHGEGSIAARIALFISVLPLYEFRYEEIRAFASDALRILAEKGERIRHVALTIHGVGYGLDEQEAMQSQLAGLLDGLEASRFPHALETLTFVERGAARARRLGKILDEAIPGRRHTIKVGHRRAQRPEELAHTAQDVHVARRPSSKPSLYVLMGPREHMDDYFRYGVEAPARRAGYLCERAMTSPSSGGTSIAQTGNQDIELKVALRDFLTRHFNRAEMQSLCQDRDIPFEELGGGGLSDLARELVEWLNRRARIAELTSHVMKLRPGIRPPVAFRSTQNDEFEFEREKSRLDTAQLMIADVSHADTTTLLLVGYAWGKGKPVLLLAHAGTTEIPPSLRSQRCLFYNSIAALEEALDQELALLMRVSH